MSEISFNKVKLKHKSKFVPHARHATLRECHLVRYSNVWWVIKEALSGGTRKHGQTSTSLEATWHEAGTVFVAHTYALIAIKDER